MKDEQKTNRDAIYHVSTIQGIAMINHHRLVFQVEKSLT